MLIKSAMLCQQALYKATVHEHMHSTVQYFPISGLYNATVSVTFATTFSPFVTKISSAVATLGPVIT